MTPLVYKGSKIFVGGGNTVEFLMMDLEDPVPRGWKTMQAMPTARKAPGLEWCGETIFALGGNGISAIDEYDITTNTWTTLDEVLPHSDCTPFTMKVGSTSSLIWQHFTN